MYIDIRAEQKPGEDANGTANVAVIAVLGVIGGVFLIGMLYMLWAAVMSKRYGEELDD